MNDLNVTLEQGKIRGKLATDYLGGTYTSYLGIPYAKSPVGDLRFKAPEPPEPWEGIRDGSKEGNECPSLHMFFEYYLGNEEECLNLNVHCRNIGPGNKTPVMVWIHGGAFMYGSNRSEMFGVDYLMTQDIVLVAINYRLGVLGFLSLDNPCANVPGNNGFKDMVMALKWVQKNIHVFGGDPDNVTIFGESAGSAAVHYLVLSEMAKGLFHKAIMQSGCTLNGWAIGKSNGHIIADLMGYDEEDDLKILEKLRKEPVKSLVTAQFKVSDVMIIKDIRPFCPVVEKFSKESAFLAKQPLEILKEGSFNKVPMIIGYNSEEGVFYEAIRKTKHTKLDNNLELEIPHTFDVELGEAKSKSIAKKIRDFYFNGQDIKIENIDKLYTLKSDNNFVYGIVKSIQYQRKSSTEPIYAYRMSLESSLNLYKRICCAKHIKTLFLFYILIKNNVFFLRNFYHSCTHLISNKSLSGVCHADDLGYFFKMFFSPNIEKGSKEDVYIRRFLKLWTNFAKHGNPTPEPDCLLNNITWAPVSSDDINMLDIGTTLTVIENPDMDRVKFWDSIVEHC